MMKTYKRTLLLLVSTVVFGSGAAFAKPPEGAGNSGKQTPPGHAMKQGKQSHYDGGRYFSDRRTSDIRQYYSDTARSGKCPPGLAKKGNGCQPPGQAKQWQRGHRLPDDVRYYDLPHALLHELGRTPEGQKLVRVGTDVLLISTATGVVIDALEDLF
ncbi:MULTISPECIES: RcnB family protein [Spongiibacter]|uniref:RcnB family protein n=1 Tax=Spongiibacter TaxID=630749 RepID=UPI000A0235C5|nr:MULTISPECIES: RcnB family protein [Spongiibacter]MBO6754025.1 RcnB family protein [Spongiibacter sp.]|tara:strand:+ start:26055 stop:26525 length:471 start_codon:yes stop_codon:yes gene_type:complete